MTPAAQTLNGAQVGSLVGLIKSVGLGEISAASATSVMITAFGFSPERAREVLADTRPPLAARGGVQTSEDV